MKDTFALSVCLGFVTLTLIGAVILLSGCDAAPVASPDLQSPQALSQASASKAAQGTSNIYNITAADPVLVEGAISTLVRNKNGVTLNMRTAELVPGHTYSVWLVAFEFPDNCIDGCGADDFANPAVDATVFGSVAGSLAGGDGTATFAGRANPGDPTRDILFGDGSLDNPMTAEVHLVIRTHGEKIPGMVHEQTATFNAGCNPTCRNVQFSQHQP